MFGYSSRDFLKSILPSIVNGSIVAYNYFAICKNLFSCKVKTYVDRHHFNVTDASSSIQRQPNVYITSTSIQLPLNDTNVDMTPTQHRYYVS